MPFDELPEEKPKRIYFLAFLTFLVGVGWVFSPSHGLLRLVSVVLGICFLLGAWGLLDCVKEAIEYVPNLFVLATLLDGLHAVGWLTSDPFVRLVSLLSIFINMGMVFAFSRRSVTRWYYPRLRRGYYIGSNSDND